MPRGLRGSSKARRRAERLKKRITRAGHAWIGPAVTNSADTVGYNAMRVDGLVFAVGDVVVLKSPAGQPPYVALLTALYENAETKAAHVRTRWFYRPEETNVDKRFIAAALPGELWLSAAVDDNEAVSLVCRACFRWCKPSELAAAAAAVEKAAKTEGLGYWYVCGREYNPGAGTVCSLRTAEKYYAQAAEAVKLHAENPDNVEKPAEPQLEPEESDDDASPAEEEAPPPISDHVEPVPPSPPIPKPPVESSLAVKSVQEVVQEVRDEVMATPEKTADIPPFGPTPEAVHRNVRLAQCGVHNLQTHDGTIVIGPDHQADIPPMIGRRQPTLSRTGAPCEANALWVPLLGENAERRIDVALSAMWKRFNGKRIKRTAFPIVAPCPTEDGDLQRAIVAEVPAPGSNTLEVIFRNDPAVRVPVPLCDVRLARCGYIDDGYLAEDVALELFMRAGYVVDVAVNDAMRSRFPPEGPWSVPAGLTFAREMTRCGKAFSHMKVYGSNEMRLTARQLVAFYYTHKYRNEVWRANYAKLVSESKKADPDYVLSARAAAASLEIDTPKRKRLAPAEARSSMYCSVCHNEVRALKGVMACKRVGCGTSVCRVCYDKELVAIKNRTVKGTVPATYDDAYKNKFWMCLLCCGPREAGKPEAAGIKRSSGSSRPPRTATAQSEDKRVRRTSIRLDDVGALPTAKPRPVPPMPAARSTAITHALSGLPYGMYGPARSAPELPLHRAAPLPWYMSAIMGGAHPFWPPGALPGSMPFVYDPRMSNMLPYVSLAPHDMISTTGYDQLKRLNEQHGLRVDSGTPLYPAYGGYSPYGAVMLPSGTPTVASLTATSTAPLSRTNPQVVAYMNWLEGRCQHDYARYKYVQEILEQLNEREDSDAALAEAANNLRTALDGDDEAKLRLSGLFPLSVRAAIL